MGIFEDFVDAHVDAAEEALKSAIDNTIDELTGADDDENEDE
jgi:hypothetical protein